jgi:hypothetical protein
LKVNNPNVASLISHFMKAVISKRIGHTAARGYLCAQGSRSAVN